MNLKRIVNKEISMANLKAAIEEYLRSPASGKIIENSETVELLTFSTIKNPTTMVEWEALKTVPVQLVLKSDLEVIHV